MFSVEPPRTPLDLNFQVLGFPVRVHPLFWLIGFLLGFGGSMDGVKLVIWFVALFGSLLVHELGHALMIRHFGREAHIVLYSMGGLAIEGRPQGMFGSPWSLESYASFQPRARSPQEQILISAAGPAIQFLFAGLIVLAIYATGGHVVPSFHGFLPLFAPQLGEELAANRNLTLLAWYLLQVNTLWPLINLLPVLPLDGGQIAMQVLVQQDAWGGTQRALWLSVFTGGAIAVLSLFLGELFMGLLFASLAVSSYMALQQLGGGGRPW